MLFLQVCRQSYSKEMRERDFLQSNLSQNPRKTRAKNVRGSESEESEHESSSPLSRPLFKGNLANAPEEKPGTTVIEPLEEVGLKSRWPWFGWPVGSAGPKVGPWCPPLARCFLNGYKLWNSGACSEVCSKRCSNYFPKDFETQKIFLVFLWKGKVLEKF